VPIVRGTSSASGTPGSRQSRKYWRLALTRHQPVHVLGAASSTS
jgi:hypothetical protein